jgi:carbohydrate kinase (thermoresistant glucokinase family)
LAFTVIYIMGVSGSGKTTVGRLLAEKTGFSFFDADAFHSAANIQKMQKGIPLTDADRLPWLHSIHRFVQKELQKGSIVFACSALKQQYRDVLSESIKEQCRWVYLKGKPETLAGRMEQRAGHYMPPALLQSQLEALEVPEDAI